MDYYIWYASISQTHLNICDRYSSHGYPFNV